MPGILDLVTPITISNYAKGAWDGVSQNNPMWDRWKAAGSFEYNVGGVNIVQPIESGRHAPQITAPGQDLSSMFVPKQRFVQATHTWGELTGAVVFDNGMMRRNSGDQALVKLRDKDIPAMIRDLLVANDGLAHQLLNKNGYTYAGTGLPMYGLPSCLLPVAATGLNGWDPATNTSTGIASAATDKEVCASSTSQTYGGLSLAYSGLTGVDGLEFDAYSPVLINSKSSVWTGTANDAANAMLKIMQHAVDRSCRISNTEASARPDLGIVDKTYFGYLGALIASKQTGYLVPSNKDSDNPSYGYKAVGMLRHAGLDWMWDENMMSRAGYVLNYSQMWFKSQPLFQNAGGTSAPMAKSGDESNIIETAITYDYARRTWIVTGTIPGQFVFNPRFQTAFREYA